MVKLARDALNSGQGLASITLCDEMLAVCRGSELAAVCFSTYVGCVYGYTPGFAWFVRSRRRLRRRGLQSSKRGQLGGSNKSQRRCCQDLGQAWGDACRAHEIHIERGLNPNDVPWQLLSFENMQMEQWDRVF